MANQTAGLALVRRYHCFAPAIAVGGLLLALPMPWAPALLFLNHALFLWGAGEALAPSAAPLAAARAQVPAQLIWQFLFGLGAALFLGAPLVLAWPDWNPAGLGAVIVALIALVVVALIWWPAHGLLIAEPALAGGNPVGAALRAARRAREFTSGDLARAIKGLPVLVAVLALGAAPWVLYVSDIAADRAGKYVATAAYLLLLAPLLSAFVFAAARKLVLSVAEPDAGHEQKTNEPGDAEAKPPSPPVPMRPSLRYRNQNFEHPLMRAAAQCDLAALEQQVNLGADLGQVDENGSVPLVAAVRSQKPERLDAIRWMLEHGGFVNHSDAESNSPLHHACYLGDLEAARLLLDHGAELGYDNDDHLAPLAAASAAGHWPVAELLIERGAELNPEHGIPPLHAAAMHGSDDRMGAELLIARGAGVNFRGKLGRTALMGAAMKGNALIAESLLKAGADINARDDFGNTALMEAARSGANPVLERFMFWHPDTGYRDKPGRTALLVAVSSRRADPETIRLLLAMGADAHVRNREGREAGDLASAAGRWRIAKALGYEPVAGRGVEPGALTASQALSQIENEDEPVLIDITDFATRADADWARRQLGGRSRTQLHAATPVMAAPAAAEAVTAAAPAAGSDPGVTESGGPAGDPDWPEPGDEAGAAREVDPDFEPPPRFELVPENLPVPSPESGAATAAPTVDAVAEPAPAVDAATEAAGEAAPASEAATPAPGEAASAEPDEAASAEPDEAASAEPDEDASAEPDEAASVEPDEDASAEPDEVASAGAPAEEPAPDVPLDLEPAEPAAPAAATFFAPAEEPAPDAEAVDLESAEPPVAADGPAGGVRQLGYQALIEAATEDDVDQMKAVMLSQDDVPEWWLAAAFLNSVAHGRVIAPRWLLDHGLSANASSECGLPLLSSVVQQSPTPVDTIQLLLDRGARVVPDHDHLLWVSGRADNEHETSDELGAELEEQLAALIPRLVDAGALTDARDEFGRTPLHWAVRYRGVKYLKALIDAGADVEAQDQDGNSVLMCAVEDRRSSQLGMVRALIKAGADPRRANGEGVSPMAQAMEGRDDTVLKLLMLSEKAERPATPAARRDDLVGAAAEGNLGRLKRLLARRIDVDQRDASGCTALLRAAGSGHVHVVTALITAGADPALAANNGTTPLGAAVLGHHLDMVRLLVERGVPVDQAQQHGITPLMLAAARWHPRMTRLLLKLGAGVDGRDDADGTALMAAAQNAMYSSHLRKGEDTLKALLDAGADVNAINDEGQSALMLLLGVRARQVEPADGHGLVELVRLLLDAGAKPDVQDLTGWCALHAAAAHGLLEPARELLAAGASRRLRDINGLSPGDLAMDHAHDRLVDLFLAAD